MIHDQQFNMWWPDFETGYQDVRAHLIGRMTDVDVALQHVRTKGLCVQAGGHVGIWPRQLAKHFGFVFTFEAIPETYQCLLHNLEGVPNVVATNVALGATNGELKMATRRSGRSRATPEGDITVPMIAIDSIHLPRCDLIYLDVEGFEPQALEGATETIAKFHPTITVEILKGNEAAMQQTMDKLKYSRVARVHSDHTFAWTGQ